MNRRGIALTAAGGMAAGVVASEAAASGLVTFMLPPLVTTLVVAVVVVVSTVRQDRRRNAELGAAFEARQAAERAARERLLTRRAELGTTGHPNAGSVPEGADR
jgi:hypothetical protein